jgi:hypothetical protein
MLCVAAHGARFIGRSERSERSIFLWQAYLIAAFAAFAAALNCSLYARSQAREPQGIWLEHNPSIAL